MICKLLPIVMLHHVSVLQNGHGCIYIKSSAKLKKYTVGQLTLLQMNVDKCGSKLPVIYLNLISQRLNFQLKNTLILQIQEEPLRKYCSYISAGCKILLACELWYYFR